MKRSVFAVLIVRLAGCGDELPPQRFATLKADDCGEKWALWLWRQESRVIPRRFPH